MAISKNDLESSKKQADIRANEVSKQIAQQDKQIRKEKFIKRASYIGSHGGNILSILIIILVGVAMIRFLYSGIGSIPTFQSLLDLLQDVPQVSPYIKNFFQSLQFNDPWPVLDGIRVFLNSLSQIIGMVNWIVSSLYDVVIFIGYFLFWIFI